MTLISKLAIVSANAGILLASSAHAAVKLPSFAYNSGYGVPLGFSERFGAGASVFDYSPIAVPEPAAWLLMIVGFGGIGLLLRRKPRSVPTAI